MKDMILSRINFGPGRAGRDAEKRTLERNGFKARPASGAMAGAKGDGHKGLVLLECKSTIKESLSLKLSWLRKILSEARAEGRTPALSVTFTDEAGRPVDGGAWVMLPEATFRRLTDEEVE